MKPIIYLLSALLFANAVQAQQRFLNEVFTSFNKTANVTYANNMSVLGGAPTLVALKCDVYEPPGTDTMTKRPLIIMLHSGSFLPPYLNGQLQGGREDSGLVFICKSFAKRGYVVANIDYRLGWEPGNSSIDGRRGTLIEAVYRSIQDVKAAVRFFRHDAGTANNYHIDSNRVIVGGTYTGGLIAVNYGVLLNQSQINIPKFISGSTVGHFTAGYPYINDALLGDLDGYGGSSTWNIPNNSPGHNGRPNFVFDFEAVVGDSSWVVPGLPPIVSFHRDSNKENSPYYNGIIYVQTTPPQAVVDVSGSGVFMPLTNAKGNNSCFRPNSFTDVYTQRAMVASGGVEGLFPLVDTNAGVIWFDSTASVKECQLYGKTVAECNGIYAKGSKGHTKPQALAYIDTLMGYLNPRIVKCLYPELLGVTTSTLAQNSVNIFPNPSPGSITVSAGENIETVVVRDITGKILRQVTTGRQSKVELHLDGLPAGMYTIAVHTSHGIVTKKLLLE